MSPLEDMIAELIMGKRITNAPETAAKLKELTESCPMTDLLHAMQRLDTLTVSPLVPDKIATAAALMATGMKHTVFQRFHERLTSLEQLRVHQKL